MDVDDTFFIPFGNKDCLSVEPNVAIVLDYLIIYGYFFAIG